MKIKELHIRNIASVTSADIDFERDLKGAEMFLIAGETGAGKSTLLDCISLALYKTTPRIKNYAVGSYNAEYTNTEGENVGIYKIEQYTRLGISAKDECYSEVVFEGNDGIDCHARLTLGMMIGKTDKATGLRPIKHCAPKWEAKRENDDWVRVGKDGEPIASAIGLSFEQFSRMAMLAQGEFAAFLTGDRKEKELILEQLTDTAIFSRYGAVISEITTRYRKAFEMAQKEVADERSHTISQEEIERLYCELDECRKRHAGLEQQRKANDEILGWFAEIDKAEAGIRDAVAYQEHKLQPFFTTLLCDLSFRQKCLAEQEQELLKDAEWLESRANMVALFEKHGEVCLLMDNLIKSQMNISKAKNELEALERQTPTLLQEVENSQKTASKTANDAKAMQAEIDKAVSEREQLNPQGIADKLKDAHDRQAKLNELRNTIDMINENQRNINALTVKVQDNKEIVSQLKTEKEAADREFNSAEHEYETVRNTLTTVKAGVDEVIVNLRNKLIESEVDRCPLCGQLIDRHEMEKDFGCMVAPWIEREREAKARRDTAFSRQQDANNAFSKANGLYSANIETLKRDEDNNEKLKQQLKYDAETVGIESLEEIEPLSAKTKSEINLYNDLQSKAEAMQGKINRLIREKQMYDKAHSEAERLSSEAKHKKDNNDLSISNIKQTISQYETDVKMLGDTIETMLGNYYPEWCQSIEQTRNKLQQDAEEYLRRLDDYRVCSQKAERDQNEVLSFSAYSERICEIHPDWRQPAEAIQYEHEDMNFLWTEFIRRTGENNGKLNNNRDIISEYTTKIEKCRPLSVETADYRTNLEEENKRIAGSITEVAGSIGAINGRISTNRQNEQRLHEAVIREAEAEQRYRKWECLNSHFGGTRFRTLVQTYVLRPLLNNANIYLGKITDRYALTCSETDEQLSILVEDRYNKNQIRSVTVLSGGERFMVSLALSLALSSLNAPGMNVNILFIDEGFGTLDENTLDSVMQTLETLQEIAGQSNRRVGIISHRSELAERIPTQIVVRRCGEGRSMVEVHGI